MTELKYILARVRSLGEYGGSRFWEGSSENPEDDVFFTKTNPEQRKKLDALLKA